MGELSRPFAYVLHVVNDHRGSAPELWKGLRFRSFPLPVSRFNLLGSVFAMPTYTQLSISWKPFCCQSSDRLG